VNRRKQGEYSFCILLVEIMPVKEYPGEIGWGYTPRYHFAIQSTYGTTAEMKEMIDIFHKNGIRVIMDGVYNHVSAERMSINLTRLSRIK
jgi:1,4-alpha-glucan branching enzyme